MRGRPDARARLSGNHANPKVATFCAALWLTFTPQLTAALIVLSTHGRGGLAKRLLGNVTEQMLRASPIDVLAIPPPRGE